MATVTTVSPTVTVREQRAPTTDQDTIADVLDLGTVAGWSFLASFAYPEPHLAFTYNNTGPQLDIGAGRVARFDGGQQQILQVDAITGVSLATDTPNYVYFRGDDVYEVRDQDNPPGSDALLIGTIDTTDGTVDTAVRGRSPIGVFRDALVADDDRQPSRTTLEAADMADATTRFHREFVPDGEVLTLYTAGVMDASNSTTSGLAARVVDDGDGTEYHTTESKRVAGTPLTRVFGPADLRFEVANQTDGSVTGVSARWRYDVSPGAAAVIPSEVLDDFEDGSVDDTLSSNWGSWVNSTSEVTVQSSVVLSGSYTALQDEQGTTNNITTVRDSAFEPQSFELLFRIDYSNGSGSSFNIDLSGPSGGIIELTFQGDGYLDIYDGSLQDDVTAYNTGTVYKVTLDFDFSAYTITVTLDNIDSGTETFSGEFNFTNNGAIDFVDLEVSSGLSTDNLIEVYYDDIQFLV